MHGPVIKGGRVILRPHSLRDAEDFVRMLSNPDVTRWLQRTDPPTLEEERAWISARATDPNSIGWSIVLDDRCIGSVGFDAIDWRNAVATVGIFIGHPEIWGKGIATEVAQLVADYAFVQQPWRKVKAGYIEPNVASGRLQASIGMSICGRLHGEEWREDDAGAGAWVNHVLTELTRDEWAARRARK